MTKKKKKTKRKLLHRDLQDGDVWRWHSEPVGRARVMHGAGYSRERIVFLGRGRPVMIPGLSTYYRPMLLRNTLMIGCQQIDALGAFKALGKALGYEVDQ